MDPVEHAPTDRTPTGPALGHTVTPVPGHAVPPEGALADGDVLLAPEMWAEVTRLLRAAADLARVNATLLRQIEALVRACEELTRRTHAHGMPEAGTPTGPAPTPAPRYDLRDLRRYLDSGTP